MSLREEKEIVRGNLIRVNDRVLPSDSKCNDDSSNPSSFRSFIVKQVGDLTATTSH
jgi:hypothetical protein